MPSIFSIDYHEAFMPNFDEIRGAILEAIISHSQDDRELNHPYAQGGSIILMPNKNSFDLNTVPHGIDIIKFIEQQAKIYWKELKYSDQYEPYLKNVWASYNPQGGSWSSHNHAPATIAGCFYLDACADQGNLVFEHPLELVLGYQPYSDEMPDLLLTHTVTPESGKLVLFPAYLKHRVEINATDRPRIIIGIDMSYRSA
jgi:uncharacterized protein (TIGR02466 family)